MRRVGALRAAAASAAAAAAAAAAALPRGARRCRLSSAFAARGTDARAGPAARPEAGLAWEEPQRQQSGHAARVLDGRAAADAWLEDIAETIRTLPASAPKPSLAVVHVAHRADSALYVERKREACARVGIRDVSLDLPPAISQAELLEKVRSLAADPDIHGILVQLPLPVHLDEQEILNAVPTCKDVDAFNPVNAGRLAMRGREPAFLPCTPKGILELLDRNDIAVEGKHACVIGSSNTVGIPLSAMLLKRGAAAVTVCDTAQVVADCPHGTVRGVSRSADIVVAAAGKAGLVHADWVRPGAVVLDVGINTVPLRHDEVDHDGRPFRVVGDVAFDEVSGVAAAITPVPGGVGPMTIAALMQNTLLAAEHKAKKLKKLEDDARKWTDPVD